MPHAPSHATPPARPTRLLVRLRRRHPNKLTFGIAALVYAGLCAVMLQGQGPVEIRFDAGPLLRAPGVVQLHVAGALVSFVIGCVLLAGAKGRTMHRVLGYGWVVAITVTAVSSFFIRSLSSGNMSVIHAISAWTLIVLPMGIAAARRRDVGAHGRHMTGIFVGGMLIAGLFSFLPGRTMWHLFFAV